jgi:glycosyltransferase involved in cell wall biosynthesis
MGIKSQNEPLVSVLVPSYNHEKYIIECISSILKQNYSNYELLIRDDASSDETPSLLKHFLSTYENIKSIKIIVEYGKENIEVISSLNYLIKRSSGEIIILCASDDVFLPGRINRAVELHTQYPNYGLVAMNGKVIDENGELKKDSFYTNKSKNNLFFFKDLTYKQIIEIGLGGFGMSFKKDLLKVINYQLPDSLLFEDGYLSFLAAIQNGIILEYNPFILYRRTTNSISGYDLQLNSVKTVEKEIKFCKLFLSFEEAKLQFYLENKIQTKNWGKALHLLMQRILCLQIKIAFTENKPILQLWIKLLWHLIFVPKTKGSIKILLFSLNNSWLKKLIVLDYKRSAKIFE